VRSAGRKLAFFISALTIAALIGLRNSADYLEKTLSTAEHREKADKLSLEISLIAGHKYRQFLRENAQSTKKLMGW
jgi:hypothetical protein